MLWAQLYLSNTGHWAYLFKLLHFVFFFCCCTVAKWHANWHIFNSPIWWSSPPEICFGSSCHRCVGAYIIRQSAPDNSSTCRTLWVVGDRVLCFDTERNFRQKKVCHKFMLCSLLNMEKYKLLYDYTFNIWIYTWHLARSFLPVQTTAAEAWLAATAHLWCCSLIHFAVSGSLTNVFSFLLLLSEFGYAPEHDNVKSGESSNSSGSCPALRSLA